MGPVSEGPGRHRQNLPERYPDARGRPASVRRSPDAGLRAVGPARLSSVHIGRLSRPESADPAVQRQHLDQPIHLSVPGPRSHRGLQRHRLQSGRQLHLRHRSSGGLKHSSAAHREQWCGAARRDDHGGQHKRAERLSCRRRNRVGRFLLPQVSGCGRSGALSCQPCDQDCDARQPDASAEFDRSRLVQRPAVFARRDSRGSIHDRP
ncbi:hypothetical protein D3C73_836500 [compost metagenome]